MQPNFALLWRRDGSEGVKWYIRGIRPDGTFYGEVLHTARRRASWVEGRLTGVDAKRCRDILDTFAARPALPPSTCFALLARWFTTLGTAEVVFKYEVGDEEMSSDARAFLELKRLLDPVISEAEAHLA
jgi:hypothetical protein